MLVLLYEFKAGLNAYLARLGDKAPVKTLADVIAFNEKNKAAEMPFFGQDLLVKSEAKGPLTDKAYKDARALCLRLARTEGIDAVLAKHRLDALVAPTGGPAWLTDLVTATTSAAAPRPRQPWPATRRSPSRMGQVFGLPVGLSFFTPAWGEPTLLKLAYAFEQATKARVPPRFRPTVEFA